MNANSDIPDVDTGLETGKGVDSSEHEETRNRAMTEKGRDYQFHLLKGKFRNFASLWKKEITSVSVLLSDSVDCRQLRVARSKLDARFSELAEVWEAFRDFDEADVADLASKYEFIENEHMRIMSLASETIRSIESEVGSHRSSKRSAVSAPGSEKAAAAAEAASLRAKLRFIDAEAKAKAELERIETMKQLEMASIKAEVLDSMDPYSFGVTLRQIEQLPQDDMSKYVDQYVTSQSVGFKNSKNDVNEPVSVPKSQIHPSVTKSEVNLPTVSDDHPPDAYPDSHKLNPNATTFQKRVVETHSDVNSIISDTSLADSESDSPQMLNQSLIELARTLADQVSLNRLPSPEPNVFNGDPLQYPAWKTAFKTLIDQRKIAPDERIHYLKRYVGGPVRQVIENYFLVPSDNSYDKAKALLEERYGDPFIVASAFRDKLDTWPKVQSRDAVALLKFSDFLRQCLNAMESTPSLQIFNDCRENRKLLTKLPEWLVVRWNRIVYGHKEDKGAFPPFKLFVDLVAKEAKIASDPVTSVHSLKESHWSDQRGSQDAKFQKVSHEVHKSSGRSFLSGSKEGSSCDKPKPDRALNTSNEDVCVLCKGSHDLDDCRRFGQKTLLERKANARENGLCFGCLRSGHISRKCRQRKQCKVCSKLHPTSFHGDKADPTFSQRDAHASNSYAGSERIKSGVTFLSDIGTDSKCSTIVPVYVSHVDNPDHERLVYALLDSQSDTTFVLQDTSEALGVSGTPVKLSLSTMLSEDKVVRSHKVKGLMVRGYDSCERLHLPDAYTRHIMPANRSHIPTPETARAWPHLEHIASSLMPLNSCEIGLLIGYNCYQALLPCDVVPPVGEGPFGQKTDLGWSIVGIVRHGHVEEDSIGVSHRLLAREVHSDLAASEDSCVHSVMFSLRTEVKEVVSSDVLRLMERNFEDPESNSTHSHSFDDQLFLSMMSEGIRFVDGQYEMPLPFKGSKPVLPNNRSYALKRVRNLQKRLIGDKDFCQRYSEFMSDLVRKGHAEKVQEQVVDNYVWYIPHHGVYHPHKPDKIRVVFDCSATFQGHSLNQHLLQGPDLTNKLVGVLSRFRKEPVAVICDIEQMFYQFKVSPGCRDYLRFLWWDSDDYSLDPVDYRMNVHLFGATSSPGCANFGLKQLAHDNEAEFGKDASKFIDRDFYVDDGLKSLPTAGEAVDLLARTGAMCRKAGLRLHKFVSNSKEVIQSFDPKDLAKDLKNVDLTCDKLPIERALGISWCVESDSFQFKIVLKNRPLTRRGILSSVGCLYDPLGLIAPVVLQGKQILQQMCADKSDWDDPLPENLHSKWQQWREGLEHLSSLRISRCIKPENFGEVSAVELHHFSDASSVGYGQCSYVRLINQESDIYCTLLMGKSRVVPLKPLTIPRLELVAAVLSIRAGNLLQQELDFDKVDHVYWTDSKVVLGYIGNESRRFHVFVANRVQQIRNHGEPYQWHHVGTDENPADIASRGAQAKDFVNSRMRFCGPDFIWQKNLTLKEVEMAPVDPSDPEVKKSVCFHVEKGPPLFPSILERLRKFSSWYKVKVAVALCLRLKAKLRQRVVKKPKNVSTVPLKEVILQHKPVSVEELQEAEMEICKMVQADAFSDELKQLKASAIIGVRSDRNEVSCRRVKLRASSRFCGLDPFLDDTDIIRVGGRIQNADISRSVKHPIVLPRKSHVSELLVCHFHEQNLHQGRGITTNAIRQSGFWIIGCSSLVSSLLAKCLVCRKLRAVVQEQKMAELPSDRLEPSPPFTYCAVDLFGPFYVKDGRKELKRYGVLFTCMACRAVHVETVNSLETDSFINCLRRFIAIRGPMRQLRSDRGTNFVGAKNELHQALHELNVEKIQQFLLEQNCDLFGFKMNVPSASHMGGVWERQIRSIRSVLNYLLQTHGTQLDDESLRTFLAEAAAIVNCRPLTVENLNDPLSSTPLSPNQLLTMKSKVILPPPGNFQKEDLYLRKRWRRTQYLIDQFWSRWKLEYLQNLQVRNKWLLPNRNMQVGDIVILKEDGMARNQWRLGRLVETTVDDDGLVRKVKVVLADSCLDNKGIRKSPVTVLERPIQKLILLQESEDIPI